MSTSLLRRLDAIQLFSTLEISIIIALTCVYFSVIWLVRRQALPKGSPKAAAENLPVIGALRFFSARWDLFRQCAAESATGNFSFHVGRFPAIGLSGHSTRKSFFESKQLSLAEAYSTLMGIAPPAKVQNEAGKDITGTSDFNNYFIKRLTFMLKRENFARGLPTLLKDCRARMDDLKAQPIKITDPFESIWRTVYHLTMRTVGCDDIADDRALLDETLWLYETIEKCSAATPTSVAFPSLPRPALLRRKYYGMKLYLILQRIVDGRKRTGEKHGDPMQVLIDQGDSVQNILALIIGSLSAGVFNTGVIVAYLLEGLTQCPHWLERISKEVEIAARNHRTSKEMSLVDALCSMPLEAWEKELPSIDIVLKEAIRLQLYGTFLRMNISGKDISMGDEIIPDGAFAMYHIADTHFNPQIYTEPEKFDPDRYLPGRAEDKKEPYAWLGWGAGRHPCQGMKFAKLEVNIIVALFVASFDFSLCDAMGNPTDQLPPPELNAVAAKKPSKRVFLKYSERDSFDY